MIKQFIGAIQKKRLLNFVLVLVVLALGIGIGTVITYKADATGPGDSQLKIQTDGKPVVGGAILSLSQAFEDVSKRIEPAVVNVNTEEVVTVGRRNMPQLDPDDPMSDFFRYFGTPAPYQGPQQFTKRSLGSGIIVDPKGYILTNNHVVAGATKIKVNLPEGEEYAATVVGTDELSDIAVIKISGKSDFPFAKIGNAKDMKVGDWVLAIGSPFGLSQTVTAGIISATGRMFKEGEAPSLFSDYLQTDAAINTGNSGGPLVNMNGEVVGINSFINTPSGGSAGVGFAIPSHIFVNVYNQILQAGKVKRGWLGVTMNLFPFTPEMAKFFGVKQGSGVLITQLTDEKGNPAETGPAAKAGIKPEDVVVEFGGKKVIDVQDFRVAVANTPPGQKTSIKVVRHGELKEFQVAVAERMLENQEKGNFSFEEKEEKPRTEIGLSFDNVPSNIARELDITGGAVVTSVKPGSLAEEAGFRGGQDQSGISEIIVTANGKKIEGAQDLLELVKSLKSGEPVVFKFLQWRPSQNRTRQPASIAYTSIIKP